MTSDVQATCWLADWLKIVHDGFWILLTDMAFSFKWLVYVEKFKVKGFLVGGGGDGGNFRFRI